MEFGRKELKIENFRIRWDLLHNFLIFINFYVYGKAEQHSKSYLSLTKMIIFESIFNKIFKILVFFAFTEENLLEKVR